MVRVRVKGKDTGGDLGVLRSVVSDRRRNSRVVGDLLQPEELRAGPRLRGKFETQRPWKGGGGEASMGPTEMTRAYTQVGARAGGTRKR